MALDEGWEGFTGHLVRCEPASPEGIPTSYVMQPYDVKLAYNGKAWMTVSLEIGHNEIGDAEEPDIVVPSEASAILESIGFPALKPIALMRIDHQVAQKLHAVSTPGSQRAHDLIDLQVIAANSELDLGLVRQTCARLFEYRQAHTWPPAVEAGAGWGSLYAEQARGLPVLQDAGAAVEWCNGFIGEIERAGLELEEPVEEGASESGDDRIAAARAKAGNVNGLREQVLRPCQGHDNPEL